MPQYIDTYLEDQFTDGAIRYNAAGIRDLATSQWKAALAQKDGVFVVRVYFDGVLTNVDASKPVSLVTANVALKIYNSTGTLSENLSYSGWTNTTTGIYTKTSAGGLASGPYVVELALRATFSNPAVSSKTSLITGASASYGGNTINVDWVPVSLSLRVSASGLFDAMDPLFDGVDFATGFSFR